MPNFARESVQRYASNRDRRCKVIQFSTFLIDNMRVKTIILDMNSTESKNTDFKFKQYDYGTCFVSAQLLDDDAPIVLDNHTVIGVFRGSDGRVIVDEYNNAVTSQADVVAVDDGVVKLSIPKQILSSTGNVDCEIVVFDSNNNRMTSPMFSFYIEKSIFNHEYAPPSSAVPVCGETICGEAICGGIGLDTLERNEKESSFLSVGFLNKFGCDV